MTGRLGLNLPEERTLQYQIGDGSWRDCSDSAGTARLIAVRKAARLILDTPSSGLALVEGNVYRYKPEPEPCLLVRSVYRQPGSEAWLVEDVLVGDPSGHLSALAKARPTWDLRWGGAEYKWGVPE